jgi:uncharacterized pyridoxal phosphate-containing UPF0001 family protein
VVEVVREIREKCSRLRFAGLMTIGRFDDHPEPDFRVPHALSALGAHAHTHARTHAYATVAERETQKLAECRRRVCDELGLPIDQVELSMGMSHDYKIAVPLSPSHFPFYSDGEVDLRPALC